MEDKSIIHIGFWRHAREFYYAANKLCCDEDEFIDATYYLYCHAIELVLKSLLIFHGFDEKGLRKIGHNLKSAWEKAREVQNEIPIKLKDHEKTTNAVEMINPYYEGKEFEYFQGGSKRFPETKVMCDITKELLLVVGEGIKIPKPQLNMLLQRTW